MFKKFCVFSALCTTIILFSCKTTQIEKKSSSKNLRMVFAGDVMAHTQNYRIDDFSRIWQDISAEVNATDFAFMNLEAPVVESLPFESYPTFNMQPSYPQAAFDAGFNLISLANNHTDDKDPSGMKATQKWAEGVAEKTANSARPIYFSGLVKNGEFTFEQFKWNGYKILFIAATEFMNTWRDYEQVNYINPTAAGRAAFTERIKKMREQYSPDLFLVSIHTSEEEYVFSVRQSVNKFYHDLLQAGADIVVSNHPHVVRPVEFIGEADSKKIRKVIMYANGNTISGQRRTLNYEKPLQTWEYTGDGQLVFLELERDKEGFFVKEHAIQFITTFTPRGETSPIIKKLNEDFINSLKAGGNEKDAAYYNARLDALKKIEGIYTWQ